MENQKAIENWRRVKESLEEAGKTECWFYHRACEVVRTGTDPGPFKLGS